MTPRVGRHTLGPDSGSLEVLTYREGVAQKVGHDLVLEVERWEATVEVGAKGTVSAVRLEVDPGSLVVRQGLRGVKPLSERDRHEISRNIDEKVLLRRPIAFESEAVDQTDGRLSVIGELTMAGTTRPASFELSTSGDGSVEGRLSLTQSSWGIKPYRGLMGALKVRDAVDVVVSARLPVD
jgi:polyisoprenoid-binding protein YceI